MSFDQRSLARVPHAVNKPRYERTSGSRVSGMTLERSRTGDRRQSCNPVPKRIPGSHLQDLVLKPPPVLPPRHRPRRQLLLNVLVLYGVGEEVLSAPVGVILPTPAQVVEALAAAMGRLTVTMLLIANATAVLTQRRKLTN